MEAIEQKKKGRKSGKKVPDWLICDTINGVDYYYKGYKQAGFRNGKINEPMGASYLQGLIVMYFAGILEQLLDSSRYHAITNEAGIHLEKGNNLSGDILIYKAEDGFTFNLEKYASKAPLIAIEVDIQIETTEFDESHYVYEKTRKLLEWGTEKVIWVFSKTETVMIARPNQDWLIRDWKNDVEIIDGISFNIVKQLEKKGLLAIWEQQKKERR
jgi:hypothetical protein